QRPRAKMRCEERTEPESSRPAQYKLGQDDLIKHAKFSRDNQGTTLGSAPLIGFWIPKRAGQTERVKDRYHFIGRRPTRFNGKPNRVPMNGELPQLLEIHEGPSRDIMRGAPLIDGLFRPEEEHRCSSENEIVPPMRCRDREMRDVRFQNRPA